MIPKLWSKLGSAGEITSPCIGAAGTVTGSPTYPASKFGNGILSNANGEGCYFPTGANTINHNKGTIECWAKINFAPTHADYHYLWYFLQWQAGYGGIEFRFDPSVDKFVVNVCKDQGTQVTINSGAFSWSAGNIVHFAVTWDRAGNDIGGGKTLSLRINNIEYASSTTTWATTTVRANLWVGCRVDAALHSDMVIDNLKTYDGCITNFADRDHECCAPPTGCTPHYAATDKSYCTWADNSISEQGFRVEYRIDGGSWTYYQNVGAGVTQSSTKTVGANHKIAWQVRAYIGTGYTDFSISGDVYTTPAAPSGCIAHYKATNLAYCTWADLSAYEDGFTIEHSINSGVDWVFFENVGANVEQSSDKDVSGLEKIRFRVRAYKGALVSAWSESSDLYLIPAAPTDCVASYVAIDQTKCTWVDNSTNETGFRIEVDIDDAGFTFWKDVGENVEDSGNHSTGANKKIRFRVRAFSAAGDSDWATSGYVCILQEALALKDVFSMPIGPDIVFEEALALKDISIVPACPDIILQEALALKESLTEISRQLTVEEAIALKESLPLIHREVPPLEEAIAFIESLPLIHRELPPLEETLALAESFVASEQTVVRVTATAEFLAEQAKRSNQPVKRIWLYINSTLYDITDRFMSMGALDREMTYKPGETNRLTISDQVLVMTNNDKYFSDLNSGSPFHDRDYAGSDIIKVYAGFILPSTGYAEILQKADMTLLYIELETGTALARLGCEDSFRKVFDIYVGMPDSEGASSPLTYTSKSFKYIMDDLLQTYAEIAAGKCDIEDVTLTFSSISFEKKTIRECIQKLSEVARGSTVVLGNGTVQFRRFISEVTDVDYVLRSGENYSLLRYRGQDFHWKINKVVVIGAAGAYAEAEITGETGRTLKIENDAILTDAVAADVASECLGRFAVKPALVELTSEYLPSLELKKVVHVYEPNSLMNPATMQIRRLALDIVNFKSQMTLSIPDSAGRSKVWSEKEDFDEGTLDKLYCPIGLGQLEIAYDELSGTGIFVHDAGVGKSANWICFNHTKENAKTIWRDDFRADSRSKYTIHNFPGWHDGEDPAQPGYDSQNHRLIIDTGNDKGTTLEMPGVSIQNVIASIDLYVSGYYPANAAIGQWLRFVDSNNQTIALHNAGDTAQFDSCLRVRLNAIWQDEFAFGKMFAKYAWRTLVCEVNGNKWKGHTDEYTMSGSDSTFPNANKVLMGCWQTKGYIRQLLVEHYTLPSPANTSVSFQFATSDNGTDWSAWTNNITNCADSRYIKVKVSMSRTNFLSSAMPVLENMTVGYFLKGS